MSTDAEVCGRTHSSMRTEVQVREHAYLAAHIYSRTAGKAAKKAPEEPATST